MSSWSGKSKGSPLGYRIFIFFIKHIGVWFAYIFLIPVAFWFLVTSDKKSSTFYFRKIHHYGRIRTIISIYKNYCQLGQQLIDKIAVMSGCKTNLTFDFDGEEYLHQMAADGKGGLMIGAHMGNWEIAGFLMKRIDTKVNIVMYDAEHEKLKNVIEQATGKRSINIIPIKDDFSHLFAIAEAFARNEFVVMHGDRFLPGTNVYEFDFCGYSAKFPGGPLYLASKHGVPVTMVFSIKESWSHYHFFASKPKIYPYPANLKTRRSDITNMVGEYVSQLEKMVRRYPLQWFNYYEFWNDEQTN